MNDLRRVLPALALRGTTILPDMIVHFDINRPRSIRSLEEAMQEEQIIFLVTQRDPAVEEPGQADLYEMGCIAQVKQIVKLPKNMMRVLVEGQQRAQLWALKEEEGYLLAEIEEKNFTVTGDYLCEVIVEMPLDYQERGMFLRLQVPIRMG